MMRERLRLEGKVVLVTGASRGIGEAIARGCAEAGARVVLSSRKAEGLEPVVAALRDAGHEVLAVPAHVGRDEDRRALVEAAVEGFGRVDVLVNNAATNPVFGPSLNVDERAFDKIMEVNVKGPFELAKLVHPLMSDQGGGAVVNVSSIGGVSPEPGLGIYSVSKAALVSLTKVLAKEWGPAGIRVNALCPGLVKTRFSAALWQNDDILREHLQTVPLGRIGEPEDVAGMAVFLSSDAASWVTGGVFLVDGGHTI